MDNSILEHTADDFISGEYVQDLFGFLINNGTNVYNKIKNEISESSFLFKSDQLIYRQIKDYLEIQQRDNISLPAFSEYLRNKYGQNVDLKVLEDYLYKCQNQPFAKLPNLDLAKDRAIAITRGSGKFKIYQQTLELLKSLDLQAKDISDANIKNTAILIDHIKAISDIQQSKKIRFDFADEIAKDKYNKIDKEDPEDENARIPIGFTPLDDFLGGGIIKASYTVVGARTGIGKTAFAVNAMAGLMYYEHKKEHPYPCLCFSLEMSSGDIVDRLCAGFTGINPNHLFKKDDPNNAKTQRVFRDFGHGYNTILSDSQKRHYLAICDKANLTVGDIASVVQDAQAQFGGISSIVIDYIQIVKVNDKINRTYAIGEVSKYLAQLSKELKIPVIALAQLNRDMEKGSKSEMRTPRISDIKDCGQIEQDIDLALLLHRDKNDPNGKTKIIIDKNRKGATGVVNCNYIGDKYLFIPENSDNDKFDFLIDHSWEYRYQSATNKPSFRN